MIPILFPPTATDFSSRGLGPLSDCISCTVTEQRNSVYELEMQYPLTGLHYDDITDRSIILAIPSPYRAAQPFRVYQITRAMSGIATIYAQHISYDLAGIPVEPFSQTSLAMALTWLSSYSAIDNPFTFSADFSSSASFSFSVPMACRSLLGGVDGSILDVYGGEYEFDGYNVILHQQRGGDNGVTIRYGKNLTDLSQDSSTADLLTGIYPYWQDAETGTLVTCSPAIISASGTYDFEQVIPVDFSADFEEQPTADELRERAEQYISDNAIGTPTISTTVSFVQLEQMSGYEDLSLLEMCDLCDTVTVEYPALGVSATAKIVTVTTDVLLERYNSMEIGSVRANVAQTIESQQQQVDQIQQTFPSQWRESMYELAQKITGQTDSHVIFSPMEYPAVIIIAENTDLTAAGNSALYLSSAGLAGTDDLAAALQDPSNFRTAITIDGHIIGERITGLEIQGEQIIGGIIKSEDGSVWLDLTSGDAYVPRLLGRIGSSNSWVGIEQGTIDFSGAEYHGVELFTSYSADGEQTPYLYILRTGIGAYITPAAEEQSDTGTLSGCVLYLVGSNSSQSTDRVFQLLDRSTLNQMMYVTTEGNMKLFGQFLVMGQGAQLVDTSSALCIQKTAPIQFQDANGNTYFEVNKNSVAGIYTDYDAQIGGQLTAGSAQISGAVTAGGAVTASGNVTTPRLCLSGDIRAGMQQFTDSSFGVTFPITTNLHISAIGESGTGSSRIVFSPSGAATMGCDLDMNGWSVLNSSDRRLKKYIADSKEQALPILNAIQMRQFAYRSSAPEKLRDKKVRFGQVAQELEEVYPEAVVYDEGNDVYYIDKLKLIDLLLKGVQELSAKVADLEEKLARKDNANAI